MKRNCINKNKTTACLSAALHRRGRMYLTVHVTEMLSVKPGEIAETLSKTRALQSELYQIPFFCFFFFFCSNGLPGKLSPISRNTAGYLQKASVVCDRDISGRAALRCAAPYLRSKTWTPTRKINWRIYFGARGWRMPCATFGSCIPNIPTHTRRLLLPGPVRRHRCQRRPSHMLPLQTLSLKAFTLAVDIIVRQWLTVTVHAKRQCVISVRL